MSVETYIEELELAMIPEGTYRKIAESIGLANFIKLTELIGGNTFYLPKSETFTRPVRDQRIKDEFNGFNHMELAMKYNVSDRWIRTICGEGIIEGQVSFE
jgi:Mor family transcriptional regulator